VPSCTVPLSTAPIRVPPRPLPPSPYTTLFRSAFLHPGEKTAEHDGIGPGDHGLGDLTRVLQTTVGDERHLRRTTGLGRLENGGDMGGADHGAHTRSADGTGSDPVLDRVRPRVAA